jgi:hypothetical protein
MRAVVMDYQRDTHLEPSELLTAAQIDSLRKAITTLHEHNLVFGDLRRPNFFVMDDDLKLIDFDWCGEAGVDHYPSDILLEEGMWDKGVVRGGTMEKKHDEHNFRSLTDEALHL